MKSKFLVLYDYGQGGVWASLLADSADEILRAFPALRVFERPPAWMKAGDLDALHKSMTIDIAHKTHPFSRRAVQGLVDGSDAARRSS